MPIFEVEMSSLVRYTGTVEVEADDEDQAKKLADEMSWEELSYDCEHSREFYRIKELDEQNT